MGLNDRVSSARIVSRNARVDDDRLAPAPVAAQVTFYEREGFDGRSFTTAGQVANLRRSGLNDRAASVVVVGDRYEVCVDARFRGRCVVLRPGRYASLAAMGLNDRISSVRAVASNARIGDDRYAPAPLTGQVTFYEREGFDGRSFTTEEQIANLRRSGFNDRASSAVVLGVQYEVCDDAGFRGRCVVLRPGRYPSLAAMGLNDRVSSVRAVAANARIGDDRYAPAPVPVYDSRRRGGERLYEANVTSARAVLATSGQRCWVEREEVAQERSKANVPGAIAGAIIGGILGHQVGGGTGKDIATVGGVVAGAAVGANVGRNGGQATTQDVQRCENVPGGAQPAYWDVTYNFRGQDHRVQMATAPGTTITVNEQGEPRQ
ncbi:MAG: glycine zipper 2TM domain-containing protein [Rubrivivax sp.]|nr:glycine zipper 2TM domain-containing protein [Rubrivivax sp.]